MNNSILHDSLQNNNFNKDLSLNSNVNFTINYYSENTVENDTPAEIEQFQNLIYVIDNQFKTVFFNNQFEHFITKFIGLAIQIGDDIFSQINLFNSPYFISQIQIVLAGKTTVFEQEIEIDKALHRFKIIANPFYNNKQEQVGVFFHFKNITKVKNIETELQITNRELALLNLVDEEILRSNIEQELIQYLCNILTNTGNYELAWFGFMDKSVLSFNQIVNSIAKAAKEPTYLNNLCFELSNNNLDTGLLETTLLQGKNLVINNLDNENCAEHWLLFTQKFQFKSLAVIPLLIDSQNINCLVLYSKSVNKFTSREVIMLERITKNVVFAIKSIRNSAEKLKAEEALIKSNERFEYATKATFDAIWDWDIQNNTHYWGEGFEKLFGYKSGTYSVNFLDWKQNIHPNDRDRVVESLKQTTQNNEIVHWKESYQFKKANNQYAYVLDKAYILKDTNGTPIRMIGAMQDITAQRHEEQKLKLFASVITNTNDSVIISKINSEEALNTEIVYVNKAFCNMIGYNELEIIGRNPFFITGNFTNLNGIQELKSKMEKMENFEMELLNYKKDGTPIWVNFSSVPVTNEMGEYSHWVSIQRDITERKIAEEEKEVFYKIIKTMNDAEFLDVGLYNILKIICLKFKFSYAEVWVINFDKSKLMYRNNWQLNQNMSLMDGFENIIEAKLGNGIAGITWQEKDFVIWNDLQNSPLNRKKLAKDAGLVSAIGIPVFFNGEIISIISLFSESKLTDYQIHSKLLKTISNQLGTYIQKSKTEDELNRFFNLSPDLLCIVGYDGYFKKINTAVVELLGYTSQEILNNLLIDFVHPLDKELTIQKRKQIQEGNVLTNFENRYVAKNGDVKWLSWTTIPIQNEGLTFGVAKDVTERKKMEDERKDLIQELTRSNMELKQFSYITSHNMRSPLTNLMAISNLIDTSNITDKSTVELIEGFKLSTIHLNETLNDLIKILIIKENTNIELENVVFEKVLNTVTNSITSIINKANAKIEYDFEVVKSIMFNSSYLESILLNLITNAIKYAHPERDPVVKIFTTYQNNKVNLIFEDNGLGFNEEKVKGKIFGLYQKFHHHPDSKGIGLYLVHSQINALGGSINVTSQENIGTKFIVTFA